MELIEINNEEQLNKILAEESSDKVIMVDFYAEWCGPCKAMNPVLKEIAEQEVSQVKILKVNVDNCSELAQKYKIRGIPTLVFVKNNEVKYQVTGNIPKQELMTRIKSIS